MRPPTKTKTNKSLQGSRRAGNRRAWADYVAKHLWAKKHIDKKRQCKFCGRKPPKVARLELANISGKYLRTKSDWLTLCTSCHQKFDFRRKITHCPNGHKYITENIYINCRGHRECKICRKISQVRFKEKKLCVA